LGDLLGKGRGKDADSEGKVRVYRAGRRTDPANMSLAGSPYGSWTDANLVKGQSLADALHWVEPEQNAWRLRILDCRPLTLTSTSVTNDPRIVESFANLRQSDGSQHKGLSPANASRLDGDLHFPFNGESLDGPLFLADVMEDKWDIYLYGGHLYFARSWSGDLKLRAKIDLVAPDARITWVEAELRDEYEDPTFVISAVDFLMKSHLYGREVPHPIPEGFSGSPEAIAGLSMSLFGRWASFARLGDTTSIGMTGDDNPGDG
jgi:hypothetical protein